MSCPPQLLAWCSECPCHLKEVRREQYSQGRITSDVPAPLEIQAVRDLLRARGREMQAKNLNAQVSAQVRIGLVRACCANSMMACPNSAKQSLHGMDGHGSYRGSLRCTWQWDTQVTSQEHVERSSELLSNAQMNNFSFAAHSAPSCCHLPQKAPNHAHSTGRPPQLGWFTAMCPGRQALSDAHPKAIRCCTGQVQSTLQFYAVQSPWSHREFLQNRHLKTSERAVLPVLQGHENTSHQRREDGVLPARLPAQDFLCQSNVEEVDRSAHAAAAQARGPHSPRPRSCRERMPAVPALCDAACPAPALLAACLVARVIAPALGFPPAVLGQSTRQAAGPTSST